MSSPEAPSESVFMAIVEHFHTDLLRLAYAMSGDRTTAEDAVQSAWQAAWRSRHDLREPDKIRGWLFTITANEVRRQSRRRRLTQRLGERASERSSVVEFVPRDVDLARALSRLSMRDRQLIGLHFGLGLTSEEIGPQVGLSASATRVRLHRVLGRLRLELEPDE
jgi:RNA polymerase sigma-70 factor (ECF subfamily)